MSQKSPTPSQPSAPPSPAPTAELNARMRAFIQGELTLADLYELTQEELYGIAAQGRRLHENGKFEAAQQIFEGLTTLAPNEASFHTGLGAVYQRLELLDRACEEYDRALALNERDLAALCNRAEVRLQQGKIEEAAKDLQRIAELDPKGEQGFSQRARGMALALSTIVQKLQEPQPPPAK
jgi:Flp pilus assembly protein TadD